MIDIISAALSLFAVLFLMTTSSRKFRRPERRLGLMIKAFYAMETISVMPWLT